MADPATLLLLSIGSTAAATGVNIYTAQQQGKYQAALARRNAQIEDQNAQIQLEQSLISAEGLGDQQRDARGSLHAAQGASGFLASSVSSALARRRQDALFNRERLQVLRGGHHAARTHRVAGTNFRLHGRQARRTANLNSLGYAFGGAASALQTASTISGG